MYFVYIIQSIKDNSYYIGAGKDVEKRLYEHNFGRTGYTKVKRPWKLVYKESFTIFGEAVKRERYLKRLKSSKMLKKIIGLMGP